MIINNKIIPTLVRFSELPVGTWYLDGDNMLNMKISNEDCDNAFCPELKDDDLCAEDLDCEVAPVEVEINVLSYVKV